MSKILIKNIKGLVGVFEHSPAILRGDDLSNLPILENAFLAIENDLIIAYGKMEDWEGIIDWRDLEIIDASDRYVLPSWCDSHTHLVFAASREGEFVDRINGLTYEEIAARGGGILNSAEKMANATEDELYESSMTRIQEIMEHGTGAVEIKSGYGLSVESELKMLRVIKRLKADSPLAIKATFLGAHAFPKEFKENHAGYIKLIIEEMLPLIAEENLADYIDAFCEANYFSTEELDQILAAGKKHNLQPKVHVNQFNAIGGIKTAIKHEAVSVDHLEVMNEEDYELLANSNTIATLLPSCSFFINLPYAPANKMIEKNIAVALATDYNPGSTPSGNMNYVLSLACIHMKMKPETAILAATVNGAHAMGLGDSVGSITVGKKANMNITKPMPSLAYLPYHFANQMIDCSILNGIIQKRQTSTL
ncbi:MAG: imidazolonepropionase [Flavobacteriales bacterium]|jgi:imidazolonepropionase